MEKYSKNFDSQTIQPTNQTQIRKYICENKMTNFFRFSQDYDQLSIFWNAKNLCVIVSHKWEIYSTIIDRNLEEKTQISEFFETITNQEFKATSLLKTEI